MKTMNVPISWSAAINGFRSWSSSARNRGARQDDNLASVRASGRSLVVVYFEFDRESALSRFDLDSSTVHHSTVGVSGVQRVRAGSNGG
jgi:hypothetical protein